MSLFYKVIVWIESYGFSFYFLYEGLTRMAKTRRLMPFLSWTVHGMAAGTARTADLLGSAHVVFTGMTALLYLLIGIGLLLRQNLQVLPAHPLHVIVPLVSTLFPLLYTCCDHFPRSSNILLISPLWEARFVPWGMAFGILGAAVSIVAILQMRRSFSVFVQIREIITNGLYRWVRHPIYCGYGLTTFGMALLNPTFNFWVLAGLWWGLLMIRAGIEEQALVSFSPAYREYLKTVRI